MASHVDPSLHPAPPNAEPEESPSELFRRLDSDGSGWIDVRELRDALSSAGFSYDLHTCQALQRLFSGRLKNTALNEASFTLMHEWLNDVMRRYNTALQQGLVGNLEQGQPGLSREDAKTALLSILHQECTRLGVNPDQYTPDDTAFTAFLDSADPDADASIDAAEFVRAAVQLKGLASVFKAFDTDKDGLITMKFSQLLFATAHVL